MKSKLLLKSIIIIILCYSNAYAAKAAGPDSINEDDIFGQKDTVTSSDTITDDSIGASVEKESMSFNGSMNSRNQYFMNRKWVQGDPYEFESNLFYAYFESYYSLDVRLRQNIKGFINFNLNYYPSGNNIDQTYTQLTPTSSATSSEEVSNISSLLNEIFIDVNFNRAVYFRIGKQTLKWGQGYFWTPTDFIKAERKNFLDLLKPREGTYGIKMHIPFGVRANFYTFVDLTDVKNLDQLGVSSKIELLLGKTEMSASASLKDGKVPVFGADMTTGLLSLDLRAEVSVSYDEKNKIINTSDVWPTLESRRGDWIPKVSAGFGRFFNFMNVTNRIRFEAEFFYNYAGYNENIFAKSDIYKYKFLEEDLYEPNYYGRYYAAAFLYIMQFFSKDLTLSLNYMRNISDESSIVSCLFSYNMAYNLTLGFMINGFLGPPNREYTISGNTLSTEITVKIVF